MEKVGLYPAADFVEQMKRWISVTTLIGTPDSQALGDLGRPADACVADFVDGDALNVVRGAR